MGIEIVSLVIAAFVEGSVGIAALLRNYKSRVCRSFALLMGVLFVHDVLKLIYSFQTPEVFRNPELYVLTTLLAGPSILWFLGNIVPAYQPRLIRWTWVYLVLVVAAFPVLIFWIYRQYGNLSFLVSDLLFLVPGFLWVWILRMGAKQSSLTRERLRLRFAYYGGLLTFLAFVTNALQSLGVGIAELGTLARAVYAVFIFLSFVQKELITAEEVVGRVTSFGVISLVLSTIYYLLVSWVGGKSGLFFFNTLIASFVILILFEPIQKLARFLTKRVFLRRNLFLEEELAAFSAELLGNVDVNDIGGKFKERLRRWFTVERAQFFLRQRECFGAVDSKNEISFANPLVEYMNLRRGRPFVLETIESDRDSFYSSDARKFCHSCIQSMRELGVDLVFPFIQGNQLQGFMAVATGEGTVVSNTQLRLFGPICRQIALAIQNAETFSRVRDRDKLAAVGEMAAGMAHEIKNPLGAIKGAAELLSSEESKNGKQKEYLQIILDETDRLNRVLSNFLDYAKPRRQHLKSKCDVQKVILHTANLIRLPVQLEMPKQDLVLEADPESLKQVLLNLLLNAEQAVQQGGAEKKEIRIQVRHPAATDRLSVVKDLPIYKVWEGWKKGGNVMKEGKGKQIEIEVSDAGPGIRKEDMPHLFLPFFTTKAQGTGLGLAICERIVQEMGGRLTARNGPLGGASFLIQLPLGQI